MKIACKKVAREWYFVTRKIKYLICGCLSQYEGGLPSNPTNDTLPIKIVKQDVLTFCKICLSSAKLI